MAFASLRSVRDRLLALSDRVASPELATHLATELVKDVEAAYFSAGMTSNTGHTVDWIRHVGQPRKIALGYEIGVIGDPRRMGRGGAPKGTIGAFLRWYGKQAKIRGWKQYRIAGGVPSATAWRMLSKFQKEELQRQRLAGQFGGESAAAVGKVPYVLLHEYGKSSATIAERHFLDKGRRTWRERVPSLIRQFYAAR